MSSSVKIRVLAEEYVIYFTLTDQSNYRITLDCSINLVKSSRHNLDIIAHAHAMGGTPDGRVSRFLCTVNFTSVEKLRTLHIAWLHRKVMVEDFRTQYAFFNGSEIYCIVKLLALYLLKLAGYTSRGIGRERNRSSSQYRMCAMAGTKLTNRSPKIYHWTIAMQQWLISHLKILSKQYGGTDDGFLVSLRFRARRGCF